MCANDGAIDYRAGFIDLELQLSEDRRPVPLLCPVGEAVEDALPGAEPLGQIAPWQARLRSEEHGLDEEPITSRRLRTSLLPREKRL
jgi:hypothetical protein